MFLFSVVLVFVYFVYVLLCQACISLGLVPAFALDGLCTVHVGGYCIGILRLDIYVCIFGCVVVDRWPDVGVIKG